VEKTFGFHPLTVGADHGADGSGESLAIMLRPGNAAYNTGADHIEAAPLALAQLPKEARRQVLIRADSGGGTHEFLAWLTRPGRRLHYSVGSTMTDAILKQPEGASPLTRSLGMGAADLEARHDGWALYRSQHLSAGRSSADAMRAGVSSSPIL
jgi:Transposase DDE domain group 1